MTYLQQIQTMFRNIVLNATGAERDFLTLLNDGDIDKALAMMQDRSEEVEQAIREYYPVTHEVMNRRNKIRKNREPYEVEKLPRARQKYINEIELFFLLGANVLYETDDANNPAYELFTKFVKDHHIHDIHRTLKRSAGAETEASIIYHLYNNNGNIDCKVYVASRKKGFETRTLFDRYGTLLAAAYGSKVKRGKDTVQTWEIHTKDIIFDCEKSRLGWEVEQRENIAHKITVIYSIQEKPWSGVESRINREEMIDSKAADTNNYFADPVAYATADVVSLLGDKTEQIGTLLQYTSEKSKFGYITPPQDSASRQEERQNLKNSILFDTFTPDLSYESIKGLGSLSGEAIENSLILGFIKRDMRIEIYGELFEREVNVIKSILKLMHPEQAANIDKLSIDVKFQSPFSNQKTALWASISNLYKSGLLSLETAVNMLALTKAPQKEIDRLKESANKENSINKQ